MIVAMDFANILLHGNLEVGAVLTIVYLTLLSLIYWLTKKYIQMTDKFVSSIVKLENTLGKVNKTLAVNREISKKNIEVTNKVFEILVNQKLGDHDSSKKD